MRDHLAAEEPESADFRHAWISLRESAIRQWAVRIISLEIASNARLSSFVVAFSKRSCVALKYVTRF